MDRIVKKSKKNYAQKKKSLLKFINLILQKYLKNSY